MASWSLLQGVEGSKVHEPEGSQGDSLCQLLPQTTPEGTVTLLNTVVGV